MGFIQYYDLMLAHCLPEGTTYSMPMSSGKILLYRELKMIDYNLILLSDGIPRDELDTTMLSLNVKCTITHKAKTILFSIRYIEPRTASIMITR